MSLSLEDKLKVVVRTMNEGKPELAAAWVQYIAKSEGINCTPERAQEMCKALDAGVTMQLSSSQLTSNFNTSLQQSASLSTTPSPQLTPNMQPKFSPEDKEKHDLEMQQLIQNAAVRKQEQLKLQLTNQNQHAEKLINAVSERNWLEAAKEIRELSPQVAPNPKSYVPIMRAIRAGIDGKSNNDELRDAVTWGINPKGITEISGTISTVVVQGRFNNKMTGKIEDGIDLQQKFPNNHTDDVMRLNMVANAMRKHVLADPEDKQGKVLVAGESASYQDNAEKNKMIQATLEIAELSPPQKPEPPNPFDNKPTPKANKDLPEIETPEVRSMPGPGANNME